MKWFLDLSTRTKLFLGFGMMAAVLVLVATMASNVISSISKSNEVLFNDDFLVVRDLISARSDINRIRAAITMILIMDTEEAKEKWRDQVKDADKTLDEEISLVREKLGSDPQIQSKFDEFLTLLKEFRNVRDTRGIPLMLAGKFKEARQVFVGQTERYERMRALIAEMVNIKTEHAKSQIAEANRMAVNSARLFFVICFVAVLMCIAIVFILTKILASPLTNMSAAAERIASGDLSVIVHSDERQDEVGILSKAFTSMTRYLREISSVSKQIAGGDLTVTVRPLSDKDLLGTAFADMIENLRNVNREIRDGVNVLASSASEILASSTQAAAGMAETTTSVSETTATVEEVKQTSQLTVEKSRSVSENAQKSALVAQQGSEAVARTVEETNNIRKLMESVAESIVKLSEQTQAIGEIMVSVSDLTQQSNLLAVNAAVEASKAGEQGKGFTVVAQEIKSLADQSKQATEQVRVILRDIQKASGASVLAAEQVSKAVDAGVKQATESGESIRRLAASMIEAAQSATQIAASSQQQFAGMDQIAMAMENIKQAAQQNMSGTRQAEKAAQDLNELGQKLKEIVAKYKV